LGDISEVLFCGLVGGVILLVQGLIAHILLNIMLIGDKIVKILGQVGLIKLIFLLIRLQKFGVI